eukprot:351075-Chlamydomonas_euryale.AAC.1
MLEGVGWQAGCGVGASSPRSASSGCPGSEQGGEDIAKVCVGIGPSSRGRSASWQAPGKVEVRFTGKRDLWALVRPIESVSASSRATFKQGQSKATAKRLQQGQKKLGFGKDGRFTNATMARGPP